VSFVIPESIDGYTREQLVAAEASAVEAFDALRDDENLNAEGLTQLRALATFIRTARERTAAIDAQSAADAAELAAMDAEVHAQAAPDGEPGAEEGADEPATDEPAPADPVAEPAAAAPTEAARRPVMAAGAALTRAAAAAPRPPVPAPTANRDTILSVGGRPAVVTAAADVPDYANGQTLRGLPELADVLAKRWNGFPRQQRLRGTSGFAQLHLKQGVARITLPDPQNLPIADGRNDAEVIDAATSLNRVGGSLVAAGAWCPPPEQFWDLCGSLINGTGGLWDGPRFTYRRNAVQYPDAFNLIPVADNIGFTWTEADSIAGTPKNCFTMPCPTFTDFTQECNGICVRGDLINDTAWPELVQRVMTDALALHQLVLNRDIIAKIAAAATPVNLAPGSDLDLDTTVTSGVYSAVALAAADYRARAQASATQELEVLLPAWLPEMASIDQMRRTGCCTPSGVTQAQLTSRFGDLNVRVQWLRGWQDAFAGTAGGLGGTTPATVWPDSLKFVIYAPGTWSLGSRNIISLDAVYDSTSLEQNEYTSMFTEQCQILLHRCFPTYIYTLDICPSGATSAPVQFACAP